MKEKGNGDGTQCPSGQCSLASYFFPNYPNQQIGCSGNNHERFKKAYSVGWVEEKVRNYNGE